MRINVTSGGFNINRITVSEAVVEEEEEVAVQSPFGGTPAAIPGIVEAENFDEGGQDVAYNDSDLTNNGGEYRNTAVDISNSGEGGQSVGWISDGEWLEYTVDVATAGDYDFTLRIATPNGSGQMNVAFDGTNATGNISIPNTGGWSNWQDLLVSDVSLAAGTQVMRINIISGSFNINRITVSEVIPPTTGGGDPSLAGFYNIISRSSGKGLDVVNNSTGNNANVQQYDVTNGGGDNQRWEFDLQSDGYYAIKAKHSGLCLTQSSNSRNVVQVNCNNWNRQKWQLIDVGDGFFTLRNKFSNEHLDVQDNSTGNGANIQVWSSTGNANQQWRFEQVEAGASSRLAGTQVQSMIGGQTEQLDLFPNPVAERLTVNLPVKHDISDAALFDATGKRLLTIPVEPGMFQLELELGQLPAGLYTIHFNSPTQPRVRKVVKN